MRIAIFGAGAVGGYFGGRLAEAGVEVAFVARGRHLAAMRAGGLRVDSLLGDLALPEVTATADPSQLGIADVVLVCVKAWQVPVVAPALLPLVGEHTFVVPLQNGVEAAGQLEKILGRGRVVGGLCGLVSYLEGPGHVRHVGATPFIRFGELDRSRSARVDRLCEVFAGAKGLEVEVPADIHVAIWQKFLLIAAWSGVGAVTRASIGVIRSLPETREMLEQAMQEVFDLAHARGIALPETTIKMAFGFFDDLPAASTASMQRDVLAGRPSELESQNGAVVRLGAEVGVATPLNHFLYASLLPSERGVRGA